MKLFQSESRPKDFPPGLECSDERATREDAKVLGEKIDTFCFSGKQREQKVNCFTSTEALRLVIYLTVMGANRIAFVKSDLWKL